MGTERPVSRRGFLRAAAGATVVTGASGTATAASEKEGESAGSKSIEVAVGPGGNFRFDPDSPTIPPGTTVTFAWKSPNHNVVPDGQPDGANWGGEGETGTTFDTGHTYSHTFDTEGTYEYIGTPHQSAGMVGSITVEAGASLPGEESSGGGGPSIPDGAKAIGVATTVAMVTTLGLAFTLLKYGGSQPEG